MKTAFTFMVVLVLFACFAVGAFAGPVSDKLTPEELTKVKAGEIVLKNIMDNKTKKGSGVAFGTFACDLDTFWKIIYDYPHYSEIFPRIISAKIVKKDDKRFLTDFVMDASVKKLVYTSWNEPSEDKLRLDFGLEKSYPHKYFSEMGGYWLLEKLDENLYLAEYKVAVSLDLPMGVDKIVGPIIKYMTGKDLPNVFHSVRKQIKK